MAQTNQRAIPVALLVIAAVLLVARIAFRPDDGSAGLVRWVSADAGLALAKQTGKPILFDFTAEWCAPCHVLEKEVFADPTLAAEINERFVPIRVTDRQREEGRNPPRVAELEQRYSVRAFPTVVFTDPNGSERARMEGFSGRDEFERVMESAR